MHTTPHPILFGIPNCNTVKKARDWLAEQGIDFTFHDFKKSGVSAADITHWLRFHPIEKLLNRKGTTWRNLPAPTQASAADPEQAIALMIAHPSVIKRPVLVLPHTVLLGFDAAIYHTTLLEKHAL